MNPERFCIDYPSRVMTLLEQLSPQATELDLSTTFIVSLAMPMLVIPFERLKSGNVFSDAKVDSALHKALEQMKSVQLEKTPFWTESDRERWHFAYLVRNVDRPSAWLDANGEHPLRRGSPNLAAAVPFDDIINTMRHGLAHGCVVYLDENGDERPGRRVTQVAFLSRATVTSTQAGTHRLVAVEEEALKAFLLSWCRWLQGFQLSSTLRLGA